MTGTEIYTAALAVLSQEPGDNEKWDRMAVSWLNLALAQALPTENSLREEGGFSLLSAAPRVETLGEKVKVPGSPTRPRTTASDLPRNWLTPG